ncbi:hypothetical protein BDV96DRAFT_561148 [Lophiotrema nucula]|uniref:Uncharacterized protein n=1 Tax=Lophiotrema nucula TaxID=690887 RepID=A0A6A5ZWK0_9PLEO|nr:hypothetical protein BDV96DRAFT_561148 [Lophiotrema nucula]
MAARSLASATLSRSLSSAIVQQATPAMASRYLSTKCRFLPQYARPRHSRPSFLQQRQQANSTLALYQVPPASIPQPLPTLRASLSQRYTRARPALINFSRWVRDNYWFRYGTRMARNGMMWWTKRLAINLVLDVLLLGWLVKESAEDKAKKRKDIREWQRRSEEAEERNQKEYEVWLGKMSLIGNWG